LNWRDGCLGFWLHRRYAILALAFISGGSAPYEDQKSGVVNDFIESFDPSPGNIAADSPQNRLQFPARLGIALQFLVPRIGMPRFIVRQPRQEFLKFLVGKRPDLLGDLLDVRGHDNFNLFTRHSSEIVGSFLRASNAARSSASSAKSARKASL